MKAWQVPELGDPWDLLTPAELAPPQASEGRVRIRVEATDLNFADILQCQGRYQVKLTPPFVPGMFSAGTVTAVGNGARWQVGDRIIGPTVDGWGGYAEECLLLGDEAHRLPVGVSTRVASAMHVTYGTAWFALFRRGNLQPGETVLVLAAAGGVGSAAVEMARAHGCWVAAAAGGSSKGDVCRALGADLVIDYNVENLYEQVMAATDGRGVDVVYDPVGGEFFDIARRLVAWEGRLLVVGFASGAIPAAPANHALVKNYSVVGVHMGAYRQHNPEPLRQCYDELHEALLDGRINPLISRTIGFDALPDTLQQLANRATTGRVVFEPH